MELRGHVLADYTQGRRPRSSERLSRVLGRCSAPSAFLPMACGMTCRLSVLTLVRLYSLRNEANNEIPAASSGLNLSTHIHVNAVRAASPDLLPVQSQDHPIELPWSFSSASSRAGSCNAAHLRDLEVHQALPDLEAAAAPPASLRGPSPTPRPPESHSTLSNREPCHPLTNLDFSQVAARRTSDFSFFAGLPFERTGSVFCVGARFPTSRLESLRVHLHGLLSTAMATSWMKSRCSPSAVSITLFSNTALVSLQGPVKVPLYSDLHVFTTRMPISATNCRRFGWPMQGITHSHPAPKPSASTSAMANSAHPSGG